MWAALLVLTGAGPLIAWRRTAGDHLRRNFLYPILAGVVVAGGLALLGVPNGYAIATFALSAFVLATICQEFYRGTKARAAISGEGVTAALGRLVSRQNRRYGGYIEHLGIVAMAVGITGSGLFQAASDLVLHTGEPVSFERHTFELVGSRNYDEPNRTVLAVAVRLTRPDGHSERVEVVQEHYKVEEMRWTKPTLLYTPWRDIYLTLGSLSSEGDVAAVSVKFNPLVSWIWYGGLILVAGTVVAMWPDRRERRQKEREKAQKTARG